WPRDWSSDVCSSDLNRPPVVHLGTAERIHPEPNLRAANGVHVDHGTKIAGVGVEIVIAVRRGGTQRLLERHPFHPLEAPRERRRSEERRVGKGGSAQ